MKVIRTEHKLCLSCMDEHDVDTVEVKEKVTFKDIEVEFIATYEFCSIADEYSETEKMISSNSLVIKEAYQGKVSLL